MRHNAILNAVAMTTASIWLAVSPCKSQESEESVQEIDLELVLPVKTAPVNAVRPRADGKINTAVLTLKNADGVTRGETEIISDRLRAELFNTGRVNIMEREQMQEILQEQSFQMTGTCDEQTCMVELGRVLGVKQVITGSIGKLGSMYLINLRVVDVETAQVTKVISRDLNGMEIVVSHLPRLSHQLVDAPGAARVSEREAKQPVQVHEEIGFPPEDTSSQTQMVEMVVERRSPEPFKRFGIGLGLSTFPGETQWHYTSSSGEERVVNDNFDTITTWPVVNPEVGFLVHVNKFFRMALSVGYGRQRQEFQTLYTETLGLNLKSRRTVRFYSVLLEPEVTVGWPAFGFRFAPFAGFHQLFYGTWTELEGEDINDGEPSKEENGVSFVAGTKAGVEAVAAGHVGFYLDLVLRYSAIKTDGYDKIMLPPVGLGGGIHYYL